jgi:surface carbohydrate biosynthesis protein
VVTRLPIVYLPIEFGSREFDSKALLATVIASRGYSVVIGQQWMLYANLKRLPPGVALFKSFNNIHHPAMQQAKAAGHRVVVLEEELLAHIEKKAIANFCTKNIFNLPDAVIANGAFEKSVLDELSGGRVRVDVAGNGRIDILKPGYRAFFKRDIDAVLKRFGDFILINTNFGITNTLWDSIGQVTDIHVRAGFIDLNDPESVRSWEDQVEFEKINKPAIITAIKELSRRRPQQRIVVRPHPGEALERWNGIFDGYPNVAIVREGAHVPWTLGCRMLLHTSCTTGFEAHAAGKMAMSLVPNPNWISDSFISNHLNPLFTDPIKMVDAAETYLDGGEVPVKGRLSLAEATHYIWNIGENTGVQRIADLLLTDLPAAAGHVPLPPLQAYQLPEKLKAKFDMSAQGCADVFQRILAVTGINIGLNLGMIGESLFQLSPNKA